MNFDIENLKTKEAIAGMAVAVVVGAYAAAYVTPVIDKVVESVKTLIKEK